MSNTILNFHNISKSFPGVRALNDVSFEIKEGEVHGIVGENGAGKSTLIKILTGALLPSSGQINLFGETYNHLDPPKSLSLGISAIYQEFNLIPFLTVSENIFFGREIMKGPLVDLNDMNAKTIVLCKEMGVEINPRLKIKDLGVAYQQIVEIIKSISKKSKILIMDEPTAPLTNKEIGSLFNLIKKLKSRGVTILYISHRLEEIFDICDRVTVMRDGNIIITTDVDKISKQELMSYMVGRELSDDFPGSYSVSDETVLEVNNLTTKRIKDISFKLHKGEILGIGGLVGAGRTEVLRAIFGLDAILGGETRINEKKVSLNSPIVSIKQGIGLIPEDRKGQGLIGSMMVKENITFAILEKISKASFINFKKEKKLCSYFKDDLNIKTPSLKQIVRYLSGGNQQKVVLAKWLAPDCDILLFDEPTRGIDVGAKHEIYNLMHDLSKKGKSIIMVSSEMPELIGMSDRIIVLHEGQIAGELIKGEFSEIKVLALASGENNR